MTANKVMISVDSDDFMFLKKHPELNKSELFRAAIKKSLDCVNGDGYLEKLMEIYPINRNSFRDVDENIIKNIENNFNNKNKIELVKSCLNLEKFPIDNPYISILRNNEIFNKNLKVVEMIGDILLQMNFNELFPQRLLGPSLFAFPRQHPGPA